MEFNKEQFKENLSARLRRQDGQDISQANKQLGAPTFKFICVSRPRRFGKTIAGNCYCIFSPPCL